MAIYRRGAIIVYMSINSHYEQAAQWEYPPQPELAKNYEGILPDIARGLVKNIPIYAAWLRERQLVREYGDIATPELIAAHDELAEVIDITMFNERLHYGYAREDASDDTRAEAHLIPYSAAIGSVSPLTRDTLDVPIAKDMTDSKGRRIQIMRFIDEHLNTDGNTYIPISRVSISTGSNKTHNEGLRDMSTRTITRVKNGLYIVERVTSQETRFLEDALWGEADDTAIREYSEHFKASPVGETVNADNMSDAWVEANARLQYVSVRMGIEHEEMKRLNQYGIGLPISAAEARELVEQLREF